MKNIITILMTGLLGIATAQTETNETKMKKDADFVKTAAEDGMMEVKLGQLAQTHAASEEVKKHAQHMVEDHGKANEELRSLASKKNITVPTSISDKMQRKYDDMAKLKGKEFDKKYIKCMVDDHQKAIDLFKKQAEKGNDAELKAWASGKISTLEGHLRMWEETNKMAAK